MNEPATLKKKITIEVDVVTGQIETHNPDEMSYHEILGAIEYAKMQILKDWLEE